MQRQLRLGDILDDYCPRERRVTNHAVVAMIGPDVKQTRCTTCDAEHEYKHAKVPRQRRKADAPAALYSQVLAAATPKRHEQAAVAPTPPSSIPVHDEPPRPSSFDAVESATEAFGGAERREDDEREEEREDEREGERDDEREEGPVHRPLIRASLPRPAGQPPQARPVPEFTIRQPGGRPNRFRPRHGRGPQAHGNRPNGQMSGGQPRGSMPRAAGGRPPMGARLARRHGPDRNKRSK